MKQVLRRVIDPKGRIQVRELPTPLVGDNQVLISTHFSLISSGTELGTINKDPIEMAKLTLQDPWMRNEVKSLVFGGNINETVDVIKNELFLLRMFGYSGTGVALATGKNISDIHVGDRVAYAAQGHAEQVSAYANHTVKVPAEVDLRHAAFVTVGAIALQGVRRADVKLGEWVVVYGLGLVGQLAVQLLIAAGARVIGVDISESRINLAKECGLKFAVNSKDCDPVQAILSLTDAKGADSTLICAVSSDPSIANNAMKLTRKQGQVVFVGIVKMDLERKPFFHNELDLKFSRAYGPGSYDDAYERGRIDYPYEYIRWTEKRNLEEVIRLMQIGRLNVEPLIDHVYPIEQAQTAFDSLSDGSMRSVAALLSYPQLTEVKRTIHIAKVKPAVQKDQINVGLIGVGNFARNYHVPNLNRVNGFKIKYLASASGTNAASSAALYPVDSLTSDYTEVLNDPEVDLVMVATRHDTHAKIAIEAARAGKHIFVEKPVVTKLEELEELVDAVTQNGVHFMAGYNRRYSPLSARALSYVTRQPLFVRYTVNIKDLPDSHWTLDPVEGGGRLMGESGHFFDLLNYFTQSSPVDVAATSFPIGENIKTGLFNFSVQVKYENGSIGSLLYTSMGGASIPRERVELFCGDRYVVIEDFKRFYLNGKRKLVGKGIGHLEELKVLATRLKGGDFAGREEVERSLMADWICIKAHEQL